MSERDTIKAMFGGHCAYCGKPLGERFHVDHVAPIWRNCTKRPPWAGEDTDENKAPACPRCNLRKSALSAEQFRNEIAQQVERLRRDSAAFRLAEDYGLIQATGNPVTFLMDGDAE